MRLFLDFVRRTVKTSTFKALPKTFGETSVRAKHLDRATANIVATSKWINIIHIHATKLRMAVPDNVNIKIASTHKKLVFCPNKYTRNVKENVKETLKLKRIY